MTIAPDDVLNFWAYEIGRERWFSEDPELDAAITARFLPAYEAGVKGELAQWQDTPEGMLALMLLFDQFPRRMFRGTPRAFETDDLALELARKAIINHFDDRIDRMFKLIFYMPFLNSESLSNQRLALFYIRERIKENDLLSLAEAHYGVVERFGRFPHRNPALGRDPTPEEIEFLNRSRAAVGIL